MSFVNTLPLSDFKGQRRLWISGSGPTLDDLDLRRLQGELIWALNASIVLYTKNRGAWWFFRDARIVSECSSRLERWRVWQVISTRRGLARAFDQLPRRRNVRSSFYDRHSIEHRRTVLEDALQVADQVGFEEVVLVGVDHAVRNYRPYAEALMWKECYFYRQPRSEAERAKMKPVSGPLTGMAKIMRDLVPRLRVKVYNTSTIYPLKGVFEMVDFDAVAPRRD